MSTAGSWTPRPGSLASSDVTAAFANGAPVPSFADLHLTPPLAAALERLGWNSGRPGGSRNHSDGSSGQQPGGCHSAGTSVRSAGARRGARAYRSRARAHSCSLPRDSSMSSGAWRYSLTQDTGTRVQVAHGTARAMRRLKSDAVDLVITTPEAALRLLGRSALSVERSRRWCWRGPRAGRTKMLSRP